MELFALAMFVVLTVIGIPLAGAAAMGAPTLGVQAVAAIGGLVLCIVFIARDGGQLLAWAAFGLAVAGTLSTLAGTAWLTSDHRDVSWAGQAAEEHAASLAGIQLPLFVTAVFVSALAGAGLTVTG